jgi:hypothetical protein
MTVTFDLNPEIEEGLLAQARERGISLGEYLQEVIAGHARGVAAGHAKPSPKRLIDVLTSAPFAGSELSIQRSKDYPRVVDL